ncbi:13374_t:CDS:2 [Acaulospora colombiana]|uniref:13374_t:CDS:1 n=1 Tax=Acaulospora colombiana TaxID=27376 RepID=A0ACA9MCC2_9GLOM|nr:13374_t:CDS:2 [Acaulospora colombiana]
MEELPLSPSVEGPHFQAIVSSKGIVIYNILRLWVYLETLVEPSTPEEDLQIGAGTVDDILLQNIPERYLKTQESRLSSLSFLTVMSGILINEVSSTPTPFVHHNKRDMDVNGKWDAAYAKAKTALTSYNLTQKVSLATGEFDHWETNHLSLTKIRCWLASWALRGQHPRCEYDSYVILSTSNSSLKIPEQNFPGLCLQDSPLGIRLATEVSAFPAAINAAATFNRDLIYQRGEAMGAEFRGKGIHWKVDERGKAGQLIPILPPLAA